MDITLAVFQADVESRRVVEHRDHTRVPWNMPDMVVTPGVVRMEHLELEVHVPDVRGAPTE